MKYPLCYQAPVGVTAPDFTADAFFPDRKEPGRFRFQDCKGKWLLLFFYSSDFTFV